MEQFFWDTQYVQSYHMVTTMVTIMMTRIQREWSKFQMNFFIMIELISLFYISLIWLLIRFESGTAAPISGVEEASKAQRVEWLQGLLRLQRRKDLHLNFIKDYSKRKEVIREKRSCASIVNWFWKLACKVLGWCYWCFWWEFTKMSAWADTK